jgi:pyruvate dehydrogenase E2 component (dihydrolipoamide acetyltransferase)
MATPVIMPRQGQSVESCILVEWLVKPGATVAAGTPLANIETDKAVFEVESPAAGTIVELFFEDGSDIPVLTNIAAVGEKGEDVSALRPDSGSGAATPTGAPPAGAAVQAPSANTATPSPSPSPAATTEAGGAAPVSPRARKLAADRGIAAQQLAGTGPHGRVIERDVQSAAAGMPHLSAAARAACAAGAPPPATGSGPGGMVLARDIGPAAAKQTAPVGESATIKMSGIRKLIASKMHQSLATTAQLTMNMSFDATAILAYRARIKAQGANMGLPNITINDVIAYTVVRTLLKLPELNAHFLGDRIVRHPSVNLGVATDTPRGLMVPVLHQAERLSLAQLSAALKPVLEACQKGNVNPDLLTGGTFTITNMGMLGVESFTPILNVPEVAILGVGGLTLKPVMQGNAVAHVQSINLSLTVDHQAVDGAPGARFLSTLCRALENFELVLAE